MRQVALPQGVEVLAVTQSGLEPVQALQGAVPPQALPARGDVVLVHLPRVTAHDVHVPVHALSQQYPSTQLPVEHSTLSEQESPWFFKVAHVEPAQYLPVPQDIPTQLPEQSLPSAVHRLLSQVVFVWSGQLPRPSHTDLFVRWPPEQLCAPQTVVLSKVHVFVLDLSQMPTHLPEPPQALRGGEVKLQVPVTQDSQFPVHLPSQQ